MKTPLAIAASVVLLWAGAASAAGRSNVVVVTIMGAGLIKIEGHVYSDVPTLKAKLNEIMRRTPPADFQIVVPPGAAVATLVPSVELLAKAAAPSKLGVASKGSEPPKMGFLIELRNDP